jgi:putative oxidoreductase
LALLRFATGAIVFYHSAQKLLGAFGGIDGHGTAAHLLSPLGIAGLIEGAGALMICLGLFTRPVAFVLSGEMAAIYYRHHAHGFVPVLTGGAEVAVLCCCVLLFLCVADAGPLSLDRAIRGRT